ncbi:thioredoxin domain-containing protein [Ulvibacterium marinum]|uniref:thioredoxin domain-containing protein n=1 Tax=Ulvibacterium marinum TaxID=2419782 RepID=UPI0024953D3F|nr:thioredoxin domain-containing protein [Ulvibacterium marinum]
MTHTYTNALIHETSPYLLQHAHNPVNWQAWNVESLKTAQKENKLLLISIGYAACHWCHVMEHECFEDEEVAEVMNQNFINIKVDREERPDIDQIYMDAIQIMTGSGGWPLNIVALPDGRPFWGATYVKKDNWIKVLEQLNDLYQKNPSKVLEYAQNLAEGLQAINLIENRPNLDIINSRDLGEGIKQWSQFFDKKMGGYRRAPKFMMPVNLNFLLHYATVEKDHKILDYVNTSLTKMAWGGIFDHVGGGFSRYSVDAKWHVPHFEKMLYDNGQLISLYAKAYASSQNELYKSVIERTIQFVKKELMAENFGFYSSLDADSINASGSLEEGAYYVWQEDELKSILGKDFPVFKDYFNINSYGHWEHGNYVLIRDETDVEIAKKHDIDPKHLRTAMADCLRLLENIRNKRNRPRLDDKILTSWNGLMLRGLVDAYRYLGKKEYLDLALKNAKFIETELTKEDGGLYHNHKNGISTINGYLEDYASIIDAFIGLYETTFDERWLTSAQELMDYCLENFKDEVSGLFFFTSQKEPRLVRRTLQTSDNVIPASNSIMAKNLFRLSKILFEANYEDIAQQMLKNIQGNFEKNAQSHANWMQLALYFNNPFYEVAIVGEQYQEKAKELYTSYLPNIVLAAAKRDSKLMLLQNRFKPKETLYYVCEHGSCKLPVLQSKEVLTQIRF